MCVMWFSVCGCMQRGCVSETAREQIFSKSGRNMTPVRISELHERGENLPFAISTIYLTVGFPFYFCIIRHWMNPSIYLSIAAFPK